MAETARLHLAKPTLSDPALIDDLNENMELLDAVVPIVVFSNDEPQDPVEGTIWLKPAGGE